MTELWYRFNFFGEKNFFNMPKLIDGMIVPANSIAFYNVALPNYLRKINTPILIDPMTYLWDIDEKYVCKKNGEIKKSYVKYIEFLNCSVANMLGKHKIREVQTDSELFKKFIENVLKFQLRFEKIKTPRRKSLERIIATRGEIKQISSFEPFGLIPPYFYFSNISSNGYEKTVYSSKFALTLNLEGQQIIPCLCLNSAILHDRIQKDQIIEDFKEFNEIILFVNNFDERLASNRELTGFIELVSRFSELGVNVMNFYGGYFSLALGHYGLTKYACGICYSSRKNIFTEIGGGGLPIRYYEPHIKRKFTASDMVPLYSTHPDLFDCDCTICSEYKEQDLDIMLLEERNEYFLQIFGKIGEGGKIEQEGKINWESSRLHFLHSRKNEQKFIDENDVDVVIQDLRDKNKIAIDTIDPLVYGSFEYLHRWADSFASSRVR